MKWKAVSSSFDTTKQLYVEWNDSDLFHIKLDAFDHAILRECDESPNLSDKLLALQMLVRKIENVHDVKIKAGKVML